MRKLPWNVQLAHHDHNEVDEKGEIDCDGFIKKLEQFPWSE